MSDRIASAEALELNSSADKNQVWVFEVDGTTHQHDHPFITGGEIMNLAGIPQEQGLVLCHEDGTQETIAEDQRVRLVPKPRFRKRPRFKRGNR